MARLTSALLFVVVAFGVLCPAGAQTPTLPPDGGTRLASPTCGLRDGAGQDVADVRAGDEFVLGGTTFPADELVLVTFRQPPRVVELARFRTNASGEFTSEPTGLRIPADAVVGPAAIGVVSSGGSATCDIQISAPADAAAGSGMEPSADGEDDDDLGLWFVVWAILLAFGAVSLGYLRYRRWQAGRLEREMTQLGSDPRKGRVFKTDSRPTHRPATRQRRPERKRVRLGDVGQPSPPVLRPGWDAGKEPTPARQPPSGHE